MDVLQQHAAMIGGAATTSCPICHKLIIGTDALIEHMKYNHKDPNPPPSPLTSKFTISFNFLLNTFDPYDTYLVCHSIFTSESSITLT